MDISLVVLAAGLGSRYGGLKQLEGFGPNGETILEYSIYDAFQAGINEVVFIIRKSIEADLKEKIISRLPSHIQYKIVYQELDALPEPYKCPVERQKPWGTGHAVWCARNAVTTPFALVNGDDFYGAQGFQQIVKGFENTTLDFQKNHHHCIISYPLGQTLSPHGSVSRGLCKINDDGSLSGIDEIVNITENENGEWVGTDPEGNPRVVGVSDPVSMNLFGFSPKLFDRIDSLFHEFLQKNLIKPKAEFYIPTVVNDVIRSGTGKIRVEKSQDQWFGVTNPGDKEHVGNGIQQLVKSGKYPSPLW